MFAKVDFKKGDLIHKGKMLEKCVSNNSHASQVGENKFIMHDPITTSANHNCTPNCGVQDDPTSGAHNFIAFKDIKKGDEICSDYAMRNYVVDNFPKVCCCGSSECRKTITGYQGLPADKRAEYKGFFASYLLDLE